MTLALCNVAAYPKSMLSLFHHSPPPPCPTPFNMAAHVLAHASITPDKVALVVLSPDGPQNWSYRALQSAVLGTASGLLGAGLKPGDKVLMRLGNTVEFPIAYLACIAVGLISVPTSAQLTTPEVTRMITDLRPKAILWDPAVPCPHAPPCPVLDLTTLQQMQSRAPAEFEMGDPNRLAYVIYTSGTSGAPRAVAHAHRAIWARQMMVHDWYDLRADDRLLHAGAFNWSYTLGTGLMDPWTIGATALIPAPDTPPAMLPALLKTHKATVIAAAPGVYRKVINAHPAGLSLPDLRHGVSAGEKLSNNLHSQWQSRTGTTLYEAFGLSECSTFISASPSRPVQSPHLGRPQIGRHVAIVNNGKPVPLGTPGTIAVHRDDPGLMLGYLNAPADTAARFEGDWFLTGDQGTMDGDGFITYLGRADDMMNAGGVRVSPIEVEAVLLQFPGISAVAVTDVAVKADVRLIAAFYTSDHMIDKTALKAFAQARLAGYKQPRLYEHRATLPTNANGKLSRRALRDSFKDPS